MQAASAVTAKPAGYADTQKWTKVAQDAEKAEKEEKLEGDAALNGLFKQIYGDADEETRRAMNKSFQESGGTVRLIHYSCCRRVLAGVDRWRGRVEGASGRGEARARRVNWSRLRALSPLSLSLPDPFGWPPSSCLSTNDFVSEATTAVQPCVPPLPAALAGPGAPPRSSLLWSSVVAAGSLLFTSNPHYSCVSSGSARC